MRRPIDITKPPDLSHCSEETQRLGAELWDMLNAVKGECDPKALAATIIAQRAAFFSALAKEKKA